MSIECATVPTNNNPPQELNDDLVASSSALLENKVKAVFELSESETLLNGIVYLILIIVVLSLNGSSCLLLGTIEFPCYLIRLVTIPGWMYVTDNHVCFYASLPGRKVSQVE